MKEYKMEIKHFGSCPVCLRGFSLHQKYEADTGHVYGLIEMCCPADASLVILDLENVHIERIAEATHDPLQDFFDVLGEPTIQIKAHKTEWKKSPAKVTQLIPKGENPEKWFTTKQAAEIIKVSVSTLQNWRSKGYGPQFVRISIRCFRYRCVDIEPFIGSNFIYLRSSLERGKKNGGC